jgi:rhodanese-related sulfurtransferase
MSAADADTIELDPRRAAQLVSDGTAVLVDVRTPGEHDAGWIDGATHIELQDLSARAGELPGDRALIFYCRVGARSLMAAQALRASGREAYSMAGGIVAWVGDGLALEPDGGHVADH